MRRHSGQPDRISYPQPSADANKRAVSALTRVGGFAVVAVLVVGAAGGYLWNQQDAASVTNAECDEARELVQAAEQAALGTLAGRNALVTELNGLPQFFTSATKEQSNELRNEMPSQELQILVTYSNWEKALATNPTCFGSADLSFARTRIRMTRALFG